MSPLLMAIPRHLGRLEGLVGQGLNKHQTQLLHYVELIATQLLLYVELTATQLYPRLIATQLFPHTMNIQVRTPLLRLHELHSLQMPRYGKRTVVKRRKRPVMSTWSENARRLWKTTTTTAGRTFPLYATKLPPTWSIHAILIQKMHYPMKTAINASVSTSVPAFSRTQSTPAEWQEHNQEDRVSVLILQPQHRKHRNVQAAGTQDRKTTGSTPAKLGSAAIPTTNLGSQNAERVKIGNRDITTSIPSSIISASGLQQEPATRHRGLNAAADDLMNQSRSLNKSPQQAFQQTSRDENWVQMEMNK